MKHILKQVEVLKIELAGYKEISAKLIKETNQNKGRNKLAEYVLNKEYSKLEKYMSDIRIQCKDYKNSSNVIEKYTQQIEELKSHINIVRTKSEAIEKDNSLNLKKINFRNKVINSLDSEVSELNVKKEYDENIQKEVSQSINDMKEREVRLSKEFSMLSLEQHQNKVLSEKLQIEVHDINTSLEHIEKNIQIKKEINTNEFQNVIKLSAEKKAISKVINDLRKELEVESRRNIELASDNKSFYDEKKILILEKKNIEDQIKQSHKMAKEIGNSSKGLVNEISIISKKIESHKILVLKVQDLLTDRADENSKLSIEFETLSRELDASTLKEKDLKGKLKDCTEATMWYQSNIENLIYQQQLLDSKIVLAEDNIFKMKKCITQFEKQTMKIKDKILRMERILSEQNSKLLDINIIVKSKENEYEIEKSKVSSLMRTVGANVTSESNMNLQIETITNEIKEYEIQSELLKKEIIASQCNIIELKDKTGSLKVDVNNEQENHLRLKSEVRKLNDKKVNAEEENIGLVKEVENSRAIETNLLEEYSSIETETIKLRVESNGLRSRRDQQILIEGEYRRDINNKERELLNARQEALIAKVEFDEVRLENVKLEDMLKGFDNEISNFNNQKIELNTREEELQVNNSNLSKELYNKKISIKESMLHDKFIEIKKFCTLLNFDKEVVDIFSNDTRALSRTKELLSSLVRSLIFVDEIKLTNSNNNIKISLNGVFEDIDTVRYSTKGQLSDAVFDSFNQESNSLVISIPMRSNVVTMNQDFNVA